MALLLLALALTGGAPSTGALHVTGPDYGVEVAVDRRPVGRMPLDPLTLPAGLHLVEALRDGRVVWSQVVFVGPGQTVALALALPSSDRPAPVLGDLRRADSAPRGPPPRYRLTGSIASEATAAGDAWDLDLVQRWRLEADPEGVLSAAVEVLAVGDLAGEGPELWRVVHRSSDAPLLVEGLWLRAQGEDIDARVGRLPQMGPMARGFLMDGARIDMALGPARLRARGGRREAIIGPQPDEAALGGGGVDIVQDRWTASIDALFHRGLHIGAAGHLRLDPVRASVSAGALDRDAMHADGRLEFVLADLTGGWLTNARLCARWRGVRRSPFDLPEQWVTAIALDTPAGWTGCAGLDGRLGPVEVRIDGGAFDGRGDPGAERPDRRWWAATADWDRGRWGLTGRFGGLISDIGAAPSAVGLTARRAVSGGGWLTHRRWRIHAEAGYARLALGGPGGDVVGGLPTGALGATAALTPSISLFATVDASAAHPALDPTGGPLVRGRFGLRLR